AALWTDTHLLRLRHGSHARRSTRLRPRVNRLGESQDRIIFGRRHLPSPIEPLDNGKVRGRGQIGFSLVAQPFLDLDGTLAPDLRALDNPMAIACFGLVTVFFDLPPLFSLPSLNSCIASLTS